MIKKTIYIKLIFLFSLVFSSLYLHGDSNNNFTPDTANPFHDVFYFYNYDNKKEAYKILKKQFNNKRLKNQAYINYGLIKEYEGNYSEAEKYYREALNNNEKIAIIYLYNLYNHHGKEKTMRLLAAVQGNTDVWTLYERAVHFIEDGDSDNAMEYLSQAIENGFSSTDLLINDPAFNGIRNSIKFTQLVNTAKNNYSKSISVLENLKKAKSAYYAGKPYGLIDQLEIAAYYEKTGREKDALEILSSLINSKLTFRDRSITLFWLARISAKINQEKSAKKYLREFINHVSGQEKDKTRFKDIAVAFYKDIILNDVFLKKIGEDLL